MIFIIIPLILIILFFLTCYICFRLAFYNSNKMKVKKEDDMPPGKAYEPYYEQMREWNRERKIIARALPSAF